MANKKNHPLSDPSNWAPETQLVHGGTKRSQFNETSEAIFLNSGYAYPSSQHAEDNGYPAAARSAAIHPLLLGHCVLMSSEEYQTGSTLPRTPKHPRTSRSKT